MQNEKNIKIASWIAARLQGVISPEEEKALDEWITENEAHREFYERLVDGNYVGRRLEEYENYSLDTRRVLSFIRRESRRTRMIRWSRRIAAILIFPVVIGSLLLLKEKDEGVLNKSIVADVLPGQECAILEMSDGRKVDLGSVSGVESLQMEGIILKNDSNVLSYEGGQGTVSDSLKFNTIIVPRGGEYRLILADGTRVWLNSQTRLRYPVKFFGNKREVYLEGEAYFEVTHSGKIFEVHCKGMDVQVLGTSFNIMAYRDEPTMQTTLVNGRVQVNSGGKTGTSIVMEPGYQVQLDTLTGKMEMYEVNVANFVGWKEKLFVFDDENMEMMMRKLARWYDVDIIIESPKLKKSVFYGVIRKYENISKILDMLKRTQNIDYVIESNRVVIKEAR
ncbi:MAG TPA: FecR family protein [Candidatus Butyricimonas faecavium]|nr:FecR family protein [Candidatus Butyricimonas faecavium]